MGFSNGRIKKTWVDAKAAMPNEQWENPQGYLRSMHNENWDDLRYILAVAEGGSVSAAARALGVNHATVLRRVAAFEERHGVSLFEKGARGYTIPPDRLRIVEAAREAEAAIASVSRLLQGRATPGAGRVRIATTDTFSLTVVPRILADLEAAGGARFELLTSNGHLDFARLHADITIRPAPRLPDDLAGERTGELAFAAYGRPGATLWLGVRGALAASPAAAWLAEAAPPESLAGSADSFPVLRAMAEAGLGRAILPCILGDASPLLSRVADGPSGLAVPIWVASHVDLAEAPRLRTLRAALAEALARHADALAGIR
jgi:DNA-binding transcriptional LysR family regulator